MCDCMKRVNEALAAHNTRVALRITLGENRVTESWPIETTQIEKGRGKPTAMGLIASYCPLCGGKIARVQPTGEEG